MVKNLHDDEKYLLVHNGFRTMLSGVPDDGIDLSDPVKRKALNERLWRKSNVLQP